MPEPLITGLLTAALFRAVEKIWEESAKATGTPATDAIRERMLRWTGKDKERQRQVAFDKAVHVWFAERARRWQKTSEVWIRPGLDVHYGIAYYLPCNGVLDDRQLDGGNMLTRPVLSPSPIVRWTEGHLWRELSPVH